jgi:hypothetical protein
MNRTSLIPLTITALATLSAFAGHQVADKDVPPADDSLPDGTITAGGKFSNHLESAWLDALIPFAKAGDVTFFGDIRATWDDNSQLLFSTGLGARYLVPHHDIIIGGNIFYDYIDSQSGSHFNQLGLGAELLTKWFDARFNYYKPDGGAKPVNNGGFLQLESGLTGWNTEAGFLIPGLDKWVEARLFAGYYQYHSDSAVGVHFEGVKARAEIRWTPAIITDIEYWGGSTGKANAVNGGNWIAGVRMTLPFEIGNLFRGKNPFEGAGDAFKFGRKREFKERLGETVWRSHREQTAVGNPISRPGGGTGGSSSNATPTSGQSGPSSPATPTPPPKISPTPSPSPSPDPTPPLVEAIGIGRDPFPG